MTLEELRNKRHEKARNARAILNTAESREDGKRELTDDERSQFDTLDREITDLDETIKRHERANELGLDNDPSKFDGNSDEQRDAAARADAERLAEFRAKHGREPDERELAGLVEATSPDRRVAQTLNEYRTMQYGGVPQDEAEHLRSFFAYMTVRNIAADMSRDELRVLSQATNPGGGYLVPTAFERTLLTKARNYGIMRDLATVMSTATGEKIDQPAEDAHGTAAWLAINAAYPESDETFLKVTLDAFKCGTLMRVAEELLQDSAFDLEAYIARQYASRIGILENTAYVVGDGIGKPTGVVTSTPVGRTMPVGNTTGFPAGGAGGDELVRLYHSIIEAYRNRGTFLMNDGTLMAIRLLKDGQGNYLWRPGLEADAPDRILGRPVRTDPDMPAMAANAKSVLFGDFSNYVIRDVQGVGIQRLNELYAANGQVGFRAYHRTEGKLINTDAIRALANSAT